MVPSVLGSTFLWFHIVYKLFYTSYLEVSHGAQGLTRGGETRLITIIDSHGKRNQWNSFLDVLKACRSSSNQRNKRANSQDKQYHEVEIFDPSRFYRGALMFDTSRDRW